MGRWSRRTFLRVASQLSIAIGAGPSIRALAGTTGPLFGVRSATARDLDVLVDLFNDHLRARACPYIDKIKPWTAEDAQRFLEVYNGTVILHRDGRPAGFVGLIDYTNSNTVSTLAPDADPTLGIVALRPELLDSPEAEAAIKHLSAAAARELTRMGFSRCRILLGPEPRPVGDSWLAPHITATKVRTVAGIPQSREVTIGVGGTLSQLTAEGY